MITVITTIAEPTTCVKALSKKVENTKGMIIIGDKKGPFSYPLNNTQFYSLEQQLNLDFDIAGKLPVGHYSRKNIGYLLAMQQGEECIYETDDDNQPNENWFLRSKNANVLVAEKAPWVNVYKHFSNENIWPRGFLLDRINKPESEPKHNEHLQEIEAPIQQGLADVSPDVDAIWRLTQDREFYFKREQSIALQEGSWCPFNTQSTWWWKEAFPLLYLPSYCSFRMTDIWKSFVAQRCLWEMGYKLVFHPAEVNQDRNLHNLMRDFEAEVSGYTQNEKLTSVLESAKLLRGKDNTIRNLVICYEELVAHNILPKDELPLVKSWAKDIEKIRF
jgi:hypothetical protein